MSNTGTIPSPKQAIASPPPQPPEPNYAYFKKELVSVPFLVDGKPSAWQVLDGNRGVQMFNLARPEHAAVVAELRKAAQLHRGGIVEISQQTYEDFKKKHPLQVSARKPELLRAIPSPLDAVPKVPRKLDAAEVRARMRALGIPVVTPETKPVKTAAITSQAEPPVPAPVTPPDKVWEPTVQDPVIIPPVGKVKRFPVKTSKSKSEPPPPPAE